MILQITEMLAFGVGAPAIVLMVLLFIAASVTSGIIAYRMRIKNLGIAPKEEKDDTGEDDK
ncbi:MAG: hypothetical protein J5501_00980 [Ruminococcus sp.]|nr:hypothetical protein [Ruminococcus sp.]